MGLIIAAPLEGWAAPLDEAPDAVFAERMMGDGVAIDPLGSTLHAPCDGEIASLPTTGHAIVVRAACGAEILMHVGLETVALGGEGFMAHVCEGQRVKTGDRLISFDLDFLAQHAKSLITPIVVVNGEGFDIVSRTQDRGIALGEKLMEVRARAAPTTETRGVGEAQRIVTIALEHGVHARPAAAVARAAQRFKAEVSASASGRTVNAKSPVALMTLGVKKGDALTIHARGEDALAAVDAVAAAAGTHAGNTSVIPDGPKGRSGIQEPTGAALRSPGFRIALRASGMTEGEGPGEISGVCAAPGLAVGIAFPIRAAEIAVDENGTGIAVELAALTRARASVKARFQSASGDARSIMEAHAALLDDPDLIAAAEKRMHDGKSAGFAWRAALRDASAVLSDLGDRYMAERVADLKDIEAQVLSALGGVAQAQTSNLPQDAILIAEELLPSQVAALDRTRVAGFCTAGGGPTSHVAILAASIGVPALVAAGPRVLSIEAGAPLVLDADAGILRIAPTGAELALAQTAVEARRKRSGAARAGAQEEARTADGVRIPVYANLGALGEAQGALALGAEGCGLLRTEFLFQDRETPPSEAEQHAQYQAIADALQGRPLLIRTLDAGGDKPLAFLPLPREENPALGVRGLRASLVRPELLRAQLSAIGRVTPPARILLPMVNDAADLAVVRALMRELGIESELGAMIETPAAALLTGQLAQACDFFSVGANDLAQYALAMDRGHPALASMIDALHPAVLRLIVSACEGAKRSGRPIGLCGAIASDPLAAPLLIGLGIESLSVAPSTIAAVKARLRGVRLDECRAAAAEALALADAKQVRAFVRARWGSAE